jgi:hypothetical protein
MRNGERKNCRMNACGMKILVLTFLIAGCGSGAEPLTIFNRQWTVPDPADWKIANEEGIPVLTLVTAKGPVGAPRRPFQFALTDVPRYDRLIVEADVKALKRSILIVFAYRDAAHFNYAHLSTDTAVAQPVHNGIFHVYGGERVRISPDLGPASFSSAGTWHRVKLTHTASTGAVAVTVDDRSIPSLDAVDLSLGAGKLGIGSFDETGSFKNVRITTLESKPH